MTLGEPLRLLFRPPANKSIRENEFSIEKIIPLEDLSRAKVKIPSFGRVSKILKISPMQKMGLLWSSKKPKRGRNEPSNNFPNLRKAISSLSSLGAKRNPIRPSPGFPSFDRDGNFSTVMKKIRYLFADGRVILYPGGKPMNIRVCPKPGNLTFGVAPRVLFDEVDCPGPIDFSRQERNQAFIPQRLHGLHPGRNPLVQ
jgi:hypothetical protein